MTKWLPIPPELCRNPELATLAILDSVLDVTCHAIYAECPDIHDSRAILGPDKPSLSFIVVREILNLTQQLQDSIYWYKQRLEEEDADRYKDIPF